MLEKMRVLLILFWGVSSVAWMSCKGEFAAIGVQHLVVTHQLANGLNVLVVEDSRLPLVAFQTWVRVGSAGDPPGQTGMAALFEHLYFRGTPQRSGEEIFSFLESRGIESNALTTRDFVVFSHLLRPEHLEGILELESDRLMGLEITDERIKQDRLLLLESRRLRVEASAEARMSEALWSLAFRTHPYRWPVGGYPPDVLNLTEASIKEYYKKIYRPSNVTLVVAGKIKPAEVIRKISDRYSAMPKLPPFSMEKNLEAPQTEERRLVIRESAVSPRVSIGYHIPSAAEDDSFAMDLVANILFEGASSRVPKELIGKKGLLLAVNGMAHTPRDPGLFVAHLVLRSAATETEVQLVEEEFYKILMEMSRKEVSDEELKAATRRLTLELLDSARSLQGLAQFLGTIQAVLGVTSGFTRDFSKYTQVKKSDIRRVVERYLEPNNRSVVVLLPENAKAHRLESKP